ncbi:MAG: T9SS type A sorting domain-containing protein [Flavobacteriales bacterium]|nr:T9SS type A sorting domain-containing protein [Flavobacteriales bacterium]MCC6938446.1 T9SS type A sorting domain-containing protein [Flavobacteriales bacterium]
MNQRYLILTSLLMAGTVVAQQSHERLQKVMPADQTVVSQTAPAPDVARDGGDIIFNEDFANGFAGNNGFGAWTTSGPNGNIWKRSLTGPVGAYSVPTQKIASPTVANGFMAFWSDSANCMCSSGAANWPASPTEWDGALESPELNLTATPSVMLQWSQRLRWCCQTISPHAVEVSTDGGQTWPVTLEAASGIATNNDPGTQTRQVMLTAAIATNPANVKFRFHHNPTAAAYHWQIDDVQLIELFSDDMKLDYAFLSHTGTGEEYGRIPSQQFYPTMLMGGDVINNGAQAQSNVTVTVDVAGPVAFTAIINGGAVDPGVTSTIQEDHILPSLTPGLYNATATVSADNPDQVPANNTYLRNFEVNEARYSLDGIGNHPTGLESTGTIGTSSFTDAEDGLVLLNYYQVRNPLTVHGLEIRLGSTTVAGGYVIAHLRDTIPVFETPPNMTTVLAETDPTDVTALNVTNGVMYVCFPSPVTLSPNGYFASVSLFSNAGASHIRVVDDLTVPEPGITSAIYIPNDDLYSNGNAYAIRLILDPAGTACAVGINEQDELQGVSMFPNPTNGLVSVRMATPGNYTIAVLDLLGQTVFSTRTNGSVDLDLSKQAKGVYMVRISSADASTVQRLTLN